MYAGGSLFLIAIGAILYFAVSVQVAGFNLQMIGFIFMIIGAAGLLLSLISSATMLRRRRVE